MSIQRDISINVPVLARVEGEGALELVIKDGRIEDLKLRIFEPPRLFEKFLEGHKHQDVVDMVARICGICPVAYQMTAVQALEGLSEVVPGPWITTMRRVMYCGEWIQSHSLHVHLLAAPDYFGFNSVLELAQKHPDVVRRGLMLQTLGNDLITLFGARSVHPVGLCVGGFYTSPKPSVVEAIRTRLEKALPEAAALVHWCASLDFPDDSQECTDVALRHPDEYPMYAGRIVSGEGLDVGVSKFEHCFEEIQVPHSTALHARLNGKPYLVGPLARLNLNLDRLPDVVMDNLLSCAIRFPSRNMFHSMVARAVELHLAVYEAWRLLDGFAEPEVSRVPVEVKQGTAFGASEAPRGILWHRYDMDADGRVIAARIVPPTSQNQSRIEQDVANSLYNCGLDSDDEILRQRAEQVIRNYDPCISCATHFLTLDIERK